MRFFLVMAALALAGCSSQDTEHELAQASAALEHIQADGMVQRGAPKDLQRALETLQRAERFNDYWGGAEDARHYAYLSRRYSEIAAQQGELLQHQEQVARLEMERDRLRRMLQDAQLMTAEQQGRWLEDQMMSLAASETDRGLVMTLGTCFSTLTVPSLVTRPTEPCSSWCTFFSSIRSARCASKATATAVAIRKPISNYRARGRKRWPTCSSAWASKPSASRCAATASAFRSPRTPLHAGARRIGAWKYCFPMRRAISARTASAPSG